MKKTLKIFLLTAMALAACSSFAFADIAPLPTDPVTGNRGISPVTVLCAIVVIVAVIALLVRAIKKKDK